jgi:hypothetical protein
VPQNQPNRPSHIIYHVKDTNKLDEKGRQRGIWTRVGAVWPTKSGNGSQLILDYHPAVKGRMFMIPWPAREEGREDDIAYEPDAPDEITAADMPF